MDNYLALARQQYPYMRNADIGYVNTPQDNGNYLEYWPANETGDKNYQRPKELPMGKAGIQVFKDIRPIDILGDYVSHEAVNTDPKLKGMYFKFSSQLDPQMMQERYQWHKKNAGENRPYQQWYDASGLPEMFRGYTFDQWGPDAKNMYRGDQLQTLDEVRNYLGIR